LVVGPTFHILLILTEFMKIMGFNWWSLLLTVMHATNLFPYLYMSPNKIIINYSYHRCRPWSLNELLANFDGSLTSSCIDHHGREYYGQIHLLLFMFFTSFSLINSWTYYFKEIVLACHLIKFPSVVQLINTFFS
jgi:hypothetical protein